MNTRRRQPAVSKKTPAKRSRNVVKSASSAAATAAAAKESVNRVVDSTATPAANLAAPVAPKVREDVTPHAGLPASAKTGVEHRWVRHPCRLTEGEYVSLSGLKKRAARLGRSMKRSELLRVGVETLAAMDDATLLNLLNGTRIARR